MRTRINYLRLWSQRLAAVAHRPRPGGSSRRAFSLTQGSAMNGGHTSWGRNPRTRPQLPFLVVPSTSTTGSGAARLTPRYFTTQRRRWLRYEALAFVKYTLYFWAAVSCVVLGQFVVQQEWMERAHPTPPEWSFMSRMRLRGALSEGDFGTDDEAVAGGDGDSGTGTPRIVDHVKVIQILLDLISRLEDPAIDGGAGLVGVLDVVDADQADAADASGRPAVIAAADSQAMDIRAKSEPWRRGYYETLLAAAATAEHVDGWLRDRTRNMVCPPEVVIGPSNPNPRPLPPGASGAPREEDCEPCFPAPAELYLKLLHTRGLTPRQQITAALAFANYLEYKQDRDAAAYLYGRAVLVARGPPPADEKSAASGDSFFTNHADDVDASAWIRDWAAQKDASAAAPISQNLLSTLTAYATFQARTGDVAGALPLFVSLLQARRSLPPSKSSNPAAGASPSRTKPAGITDQIIALIKPPGYPSAPDDGFSPPLPGARSTCEEAALRLHIGEILYASARKDPLSSSASSWFFSSGAQQQHAREEGIAWTREAVDMAEEQLHALSYNQLQKEKQQHEKGGVASALSRVISPASTDGRATCRQCLVAGLDNWATMVAQLARDEEQKAAAAAASAAGASSADGGSWWPSWLSLWGESASSSSAYSSTASPTTATPEPTTTKKVGRWAAEENVIRDRRRRARELLEDAAPPTQGLFGMLAA